MPCNINQLNPMKFLKFDFLFQYSDFMPKNTFKILAGAELCFKHVSLFLLPKASISCVCT